MCQLAAAGEWDVKRNARGVECCVKRGQQHAATGGIVFKIGEHAGRTGALRLKHKIGGQPFGVAVGKLARWIT